MTHVLKGSCKCGAVGSIAISCYTDKETGEQLVDGGTCIECLCNVVLPTENYTSFVRKNCYKGDF